MPVGRIALSACLFFLCGCEVFQPQVAVCNRLGDPVEINDISYQECFWPVILLPDECTSPCSCHPGAGRVRFGLFDVQWFVNEIVRCAEEGILELEPADDRIGWKLPAPVWHNYMTSQQIDVSYGDFRRVDIVRGEIEQDFDAPSPYGH